MSPAGGTAAGTLTLALPSGKLRPGCLAVLRRAGLPVEELGEGDSRELVVEASRGGLRYVLTKPLDVPTYVEYGAADVGVAGRDVLEEMGRDVYRLRNLVFGRARLALAGPAGLTLAEVRSRPLVRVATKYPHLTRQHFLQQGLPVEIVELAGAVELAPQVGLAELIVDVVQTGRTLAENGLVEMETLLETSAYLIANRASHKLRRREIEALAGRLAEAAGALQAGGAAQSPGARREAGRA